MTMTVLRRLVPLVAALALLGPAAPLAYAQGGDDAVVAVNTRDGSKVFRFSFNVRRIMGDVVDTGNAAVAYASCESCQTVAISIQLVLVSGSPSVVTPENLAIAINEGCDSCETLASAYQFVLGVGSSPVHFTAGGNRTLAELRQDLARLRGANLSIDEIQARVDDIVARLAQVLETELVSAGSGGTGPTSTGESTTGEQTTTGETTAETTQTETTQTTSETTTTDTQPTTTDTQTTTTDTQTTTTDTTETTITEPPPTETQP